MSSVHPQMIPVCIVPMTLLFVLLVVLVTKSPKAGAWLVGTLAFLFPMLVFRAAKAGVFATPVALPLFIVPMTFLFILLIVLISKSPKAGAWIVGGLILLFPMLAYWAAMVHAFPMPVALPLFIVPAAFLFVLLIILLTKAPKAGAGLIVAVVVLGLLGVFFGVLTSHRPLAVVRQATPVPSAAAPAPPIPPYVMTEDELLQMSKMAELGRVSRQSGSSRPSASATPAPIWSSGVDEELGADVYPSEFAAARAASTKLGKSIRELAPDANALPRVIVFQEAHPYRLIAELRDAIRRALPEVSCNIESESRPAKAEELVIVLYRQEADARPAPWARGETAVSRGSGLTQYVPGEPDVPLVASGELDINLSGAHGKAHIPVRFSQKPWIEDFATFASARPEQAFIIARSLGTCTSEGEANQQALSDACARLTEAIGRQSGSKLGPSAPPITPTDVLQGSFIVDRFAQSLEGSAARIWRQALLLDVSGPKLAQLSRLKAREFRQVRQAWATMGFSVIGVVVLIAAIYFFLNMATRGYYEWSLRIASVVLAVVGVLSILMVVR